MCMILRDSCRCEWLKLNSRAKLMNRSILAVMGVLTIPEENLSWVKWRTDGAKLCYRLP